jgi:hypothetical protein
VAAGLIGFGRISASAQKSLSHYQSTDAAQFKSCAKAGSGVVLARPLDTPRRMGLEVDERRNASQGEGDHGGGAPPPYQGRVELPLNRLLPEGKIPLSLELKMEKAKSLMAKSC